MTHDQRRKCRLDSQWITEILVFDFCSKADDAHMLKLKQDGQPSYHKPNVVPLSNSFFLSNFFVIYLQTPNNRLYVSIATLQSVHVRYCTSQYARRNVNTFVVTVYSNRAQDHEQFVFQTLMTQIKPTNLFDGFLQILSSTLKYETSRH